MIKTIIPAAALEQHIAVLGKTGSGKTSTAKLVVEHVVRDLGARACALDPIKSDWWGITSSADGKKPGLPFHILGGPHGHVPLHSGAGKAIGELVGSGALPMSILDMADFEPGGHYRFFVDFAPALMRRMRGVLYFVIEEAHLFAPKERAGFGAENMAIHWAKTIASAGRSKGIRLLVVTQSVQSLHNRVLGACDTLIAHRLTAPADQEPVIKWLKANTTKDVQQKVASSLAGLRTGSGWIVSGEARIFEEVHFPRIATYDNTATPTNDDQVRDVKTAPVDHENLRLIIGDAVKEAEESDPKRLRARITELERAAGSKAPATDQKALEHAEQHGYERGRADALGAVAAVSDELRQVGAIVELAEDALAKIAASLGRALAGMAQPFTAQRKAAPPVGAEVPKGKEPGSIPHVRPAALADDGGGAKRRIMIALAQNPDGLMARKLAIITDVKRGGSTWRGAMAALRRDQHVEDNGEFFKITRAGVQALGNYEPLPVGAALREHWRSKFSSTRLAIFDAIVSAYPREISAEAVARAAAVELGGSTWRGHMANLRGLELVSGSAMLRASEDLF